MQGGTVWKFDKFSVNYILREINFFELNAQHNGKVYEAQNIDITH